MSLKTAWLLADIELAAGVALTLFGVFLFIAAPGGFHGMFSPSPLEKVVSALGIGGLIVGEIWLVLLWRGVPLRPGQEEEPRWRYRDRE